MGAMYQTTSGTLQLITVYLLLIVLIILALIAHIVRLKRQRKYVLT